MDKDYQNLEGGDLLHPTRSTLIQATLKSAPIQEQLLPIMDVDTSPTSLQCSEVSNLVNIGDSFPVLEIGQDLPEEIGVLTQNNQFEQLYSYLEDICDFETLNTATSTRQCPEEGSTICNIPAMDELYSKSETSIECDFKPSTSNDSQIMRKPQETVYATELMNLKIMDSNYETFHDLQTLLELDTFDQVKDIITIHTDIDSQPELLSTIDVSQLPPLASAIENTSDKIQSCCDTESDDDCEYSSPRKRAKTSKSTHEKYMEMRKKNNIASRRSRQIRKEKDHEMEIEEMKLKEENKALKCTVKELETQRDALKNYLMKKLSGLK